ncbi:hypothetical protein SISSUDRAFT_1032102 [Sistotremastrum suecicum HHB10207 ss-3]|uniref:Serine-threonine/tyrosine-protein kinase catalytic domain-containing protein n=1 Tax=Sistotremastrum suecicum HHB10207 ss-3 TaxID=1314776 RepID=A0A166F4Z4_9AGAM|nr:hypothetical protein SISSUDRAFT_1032102 [Sistotremastrum suecicum HHB10207 ss-3]
MSAVNLDRLGKFLQVAQSLGEAIPGGSVIRAVAGVSLVLVRSVEAARVNKEQCLEILTRVAGQILIIEEELAHDTVLPESVEERLRDYCTVLEDVAKTVEVLGKIGVKKGCLSTVSVSEKTQSCLMKIDEAYRNFMFRSALTTLRLLSYQSSTRSPTCDCDSVQSPFYQSDSEEIIRIACRHIHLTGQEISRSSHTGYILRLYNGHLESPGEKVRRVLIRKYEMLEDRSQGEFEREVMLRREILHPNIARLIGYSVVTSRTKMIVLDAGVIPAFDYLRSLSQGDYFYEWLRLTSELANAYEFLHDHGASWRGGVTDLVLTKQDNHIRIGGSGYIDSDLDASSHRLYSASRTMNEGTNDYQFSYKGFKEILKWLRPGFSRVQEWRVDRTIAKTKLLLREFLNWTPIRFFEEYLENSVNFSVGDIGWVEAGPGINGEPYVWHQARFAHRLPSVGEWWQSGYLIPVHETLEKMIQGEFIDGFWRWRLEFPSNATLTVGSIASHSSSKDLDAAFVASAIVTYPEYTVLSPMHLEFLREIESHGCLPCAGLTSQDDDASEDKDLETCEQPPSVLSRAVRCLKRNRSNRGKKI